jgi:hypothetical protein
MQYTTLERRGPEFPGFVVSIPLPSLAATRELHEQTSP